MRKTLSLLHEQARKLEGQYNIMAKQYYDKKKAKNGSFKHGDMVLLHDPIPTGKLNSIWEGPYKVLGALSKTLYKISVPKKSGQYKMSTLTNLNSSTHPLPTFSLW